jgi:predicted DNA-binding transcriptional regulator AlpA
MDSEFFTDMRHPQPIAAPRPDRIVRPREAAARTGLSASTMAKMRARGDGPPFVRLGSRCVGYLEADLEDWLRAGRTLSIHGAGLAPRDAGG